MQIFLDTADYGEIKDRYETGLIAGITTNPTLVRKSGVSYLDFITTLSKEFSFVSISAEVNGDTADEWLRMLNSTFRLVKKLQSNFLLLERVLLLVRNYLMRAFKLTLPFASL